MIGNLHPLAVSLPHPLNCLAESVQREVHFGGAVPPGSKDPLDPGRGEGRLPWTEQHPHWGREAEQSDALLGGSQLVS